LALPKSAAFDNRVSHSLPARSVLVGKRLLRHTGEIVGDHLILAAGEWARTTTRPQVAAGMHQGVSNHIAMPSSAFLEHTHRDSRLVVGDKLSEVSIVQAESLSHYGKVRQWVADPLLASQHRPCEGDVDLSPLAGAEYAQDTES
jgi:hypothetical protein